MAITTDYTDMLYRNVVLNCNRWYLHVMISESKKLGQNMKRIRIAKNISQGDIARSLKVSRGFVSNIENGKTNPTLATIARLAKAVGVSTDQLIK